MKRLAVLPAFAVLFGLGLACSDGTPVLTEEHDDDHDQHAKIERLTLSEQAYEAAGIVVAPVTPRVIAPTVRVTGTLSYDERQMSIATARIGGRITRVVADYGQRVSAGELLAWIDSPQLGVAQAEYLRAFSMTRLRQAEYDRAELLVDGQAISRGELLRREADLRASEADLQTAEQQLHILGLSQQEVEALSTDGARMGHAYPVRSSIDGRVTERDAVSGRVVAPEDELFTVADLNSLWLFLQVFEKDLPSVTEGSPVTLTCESHPNERFRGTIDFVGQVLDPHSRTVRARAVIDNPEGELKPGMFVYATIESRDSHGEAEFGLAVPTAAVAVQEGRSVVFIRAGERSFEIRPVVLGDARGEWVPVRSGLTEGDEIAVDGVFVLKSEVLKGGLEGHAH